MITDHNAEATMAKAQAASDQRAYAEAQSLRLRCQAQRQLLQSCAVAMRTAGARGTDWSNMIGAIERELALG